MIAMPRPALMLPALAMLLAAPAPAAAAAAVPPQMLALNDTTQLPMAACAARDLLFMNGYTVSVYLPDPGRPPASAIAAAVPKAMRFDVTYQGTLPKQLPGRWAQRLQRGVSPDVYEGVQQMYARLSRGDAVVVAHVPERGTTVSVNGRRALAAPDASLIDTLLDMFVGPEPVSRETKRVLLEPGC